MLLDRIGLEHLPPARRRARLAVLGSYTTSQLVPLLRLAARRSGVALEIHECAYGQYRQEVLDPDSATWAFQPDVILFAVHAGDLALPAWSQDPERDVDVEASRWTGLWRAVTERSGARIVQHGFVVPADAALGHLATRLRGSRPRMIQALNARLGDEAPDGVSLVDCDRLAALFGKTRWTDPRYWHHAKQAVALDALPLLARHTAAVMSAGLGLSRKCLVLDLDNTLWGGVIGEDGLAGIQLGAGAAGEAFVAFQDYLLELKAKGIVLAVCSKNDEAVAREPFDKHAAMRIAMSDVAVFVANWETKAENIRTIATTLDLGLDALVFVDDNPVERQTVRQFLPEVDVVPLPADPALYVQALADHLSLETSALTAEDVARTEQYRARAEAAALAAAHVSLDDFHRSLEMRALVSPFTEADLPRIAQLLGKTNQFNLTTRRHGPARLREIMADSRTVHLTLRLRDRFADHGLVAVMIALADADVLDIDTWLMSCRVIGRTVEAEMLSQVSRRALDLGCRWLQGTYVPTAKNGMVKGVFARFGFDQVAEADGTTTWRYDLAARGPIENGFIEVEV
jgi:FkbH-like protein